MYLAGRPEKAITTANKVNITLGTPSIYNHINGFHARRVCRFSSKQAFLILFAFGCFPE